MPPPLLIANAENAKIEELKQVCRVESNETKALCMTIQNASAWGQQSACLQCTVINQSCNTKVDGLIVKKRPGKMSIIKDQPAMELTDSPHLNPIERFWLTMKARWFNNYTCRNEEKLLERLDQAILDVINIPKKTQKTARIGTLI